MAREIYSFTLGAPRREQMSQQHYAVTGVSRGIGAEIARALRSRGHRVTGLDVAQPSVGLDDFVHLDLSDTASIVSAASKISPLHGLCNNAGIPPRAGMEEMILRVNFFGQRRLTSALLPKFGAGASIVNIASRAGAGWREGVDQVKRLAALDPERDVAAFVRSERLDHVRAYNLSKEALILWTFAETEALIDRDIRINALSPSAVDTAILDDFARAFGDKMQRNLQRAGRSGYPREVAEAAAFLLSASSSWIKGADINLDGGIGAFAISDALALRDIRVVA
jgi:NAD(P)-dependent dehydrogenase (short-subunit alcohol dehydrogenase family)